ncbi:hypothetical protein [Sagittula sp. SSi028]|uniref:hypothetical protein n=1 Tax=Sagittula sp. SSi028 TaxID=3400636 RepID=UPI003AF93156
MNLDRIIRMVVNQVIRQFVNRGVKAGMDRMGQPRQGQSRDPYANQMADNMDMEADQSRQKAKAEQRRIRQARRAAREARNNDQ